MRLGGSSILSSAETANKIFDDSSDFNIKLDDVSIRTSSKQEILQNVHLEIKKGDIIAVLGQSGAGKSTLLRTIAGLIQPYKNTIMFNNIGFSSLNRKERFAFRRNVGYIPQQFKLIKETSVFENVMVGRLGHISTIASLLHKYPEKDQKIALDCIAKVGLTGKEHTRVKRLSGGEQQRVAIARCLAQEPQVILADEPMASLDVSLSTAIFEILHNENNEKGKTVIFVVHDIEMAQKYAKRLILMKDGHIISNTTVDKLDENAIKKIFFD